MLDKKQVLKRQLELIDQGIECRRLTGEAYKCEEWGIFFALLEQAIQINQRKIELIQQYSEWLGYSDYGAAQTIEGLGEESKRLANELNHYKQRLEA